MEAQMKYPYLIAWYTINQHLPWHIERMLEKAEEDSAPLRSAYFTERQGWVEVDTMRNAACRDALEFWVKERQK